MNILLIGPPGSGKGTQAEKLVEKFGLGYVNMGEIFRSLKSEDTPLARRVREFYNKGIWVPDDIVVGVINAKLKGIARLDGIIFDGFPRVLSQAQYFEEYLRQRGQKIDLVVYISLPREVTLKRLANRRTCGRCELVYNLLTKPPRKEGVCDVCGGELIARSDETTEAIKKRLEEFSTKTIRMIEYYKERGILEEVDGDRSIESIFADVIERLKKHGLVASNAMN